ncbi:MAG: hypothetical protein J6T39_01395 [Clostridia bacterium]|nr:hypothetical protein [Clostridia bacterium]
MENENLVEEQKNEPVEPVVEETATEAAVETTAEATAEATVQPATKTKSQIWRKITSIALLVLASVIMIGMVLMSTVKKDYNFGFNAPELITLHTESSNNMNDGATLTRGTDAYNKFMTLYNDSFKTTLFGAMFGGKLGSGVVEKEGYKSLSSLTGTCVEFFYTQSQKLIVNGKTYDAKIVSNTDYISIVIEINNTTILSEVNAYFKYRDTGTNNYSYVRLVSFAAQTELHDFVENGEF